MCRHRAQTCIRSFLSDESRFLELAGSGFVVNLHDSFSPAFVSILFWQGRSRRIEVNCAGVGIFFEVELEFVQRVEHPCPLWMIFQSS